ncbi:hypothetical protein TYRP_004371 [Tyrophagus putrescentiae]|nr:hypothetical protein TYRP_004371 [Tyrophagus putrescentiae]
MSSFGMEISGHKVVLLAKGNVIAYVRTITVSISLIYMDDKFNIYQKKFAQHGGQVSTSFNETKWMCLPGQN